MKDPPSKTHEKGDGRAHAPIASTAANSRGRFHDEDRESPRTDYQRDRDRIIHATAFRRLTYKTQVFVCHEGDHYRSRLTHSLEVAQIARSMARRLGLDEDLSEAIALAHDLGHPPFGHAGETALDQAMSGHGGFDHNAQSVRVVAILERKYAAFDGLNLTWESLEGLVKHNGPVDGPLPDGIRELSEVRAFDLHTFASAEAQVAALADDIAYNSHDIDDGFRAGFFDLDDLSEVPLTGRIVSEIRGLHGDLGPSRVIHEVNRRLITLMVEDAIAYAEARIAANDLGKPDDVRELGEALVAFSAPLTEELDELRFFLLSWVYRNKRIMRIMSDAQSILSDLHARYVQDPDSLPTEWQGHGHDENEDERQRRIADFIAGMTDRYAIQEHSRLFDATPELR